MSSLTKKFFTMFSSGLDKLVNSLLTDNANGFVDEEACEQLVAILENKSPKYTSQEALVCLLKQAKRPMSWSSALRTLMIFHKLTHMHGNVLSDFLVSNQLDNLAQFKVPNTPLSKEALAMVPHYYKYLQKLSYNYEDLSICFFPDDDFSKRLKENNLSLLHFLSKVQNILGYLVGILPLFETSLTQLEKKDLIKQIAYFCLTDCYYYYTYISQTVSAMMNEIFNLNGNDAVFLYELYSEHIQMTNKLKGLFQIKQHLKQFQLKIPDFYSIDMGINKKAEQYVTTIKNGTSKSQQQLEKKPNKFKPKLGGKLEIDVDAPEIEQPSPFALNNKPSTSLQDLSNVMVQITTPNFKAVQKKELFKPPVADRQGNAILSPKIRVISPTGQVSEGKKLMELMSKNGAVKLSDYNPFMAKENIVHVNNNEATEGTVGTNGTVGSEKAIDAAKSGKGEYRSIVSGESNNPIEEEAAENAEKVEQQE